MEALHQLRALRRGKVHRGYIWAAICCDGALLCEKCVENEYAQIYKSTFLKARDGWQCIGITNSGESETTEYCAHCGEVIWEAD